MFEPNKFGGVGKKKTQEMLNNDAHIAHLHVYIAISKSYNLGRDGRQATGLGRDVGYIFPR